MKQVALLLWLWLATFHCGAVESTKPPVGVLLPQARFADYLSEFERKKTLLNRLSSSHGGQPRYLNRLIFENSPYLLRHATNPIDWQGWSDAAFAQAKDENKLVFLSIGYSTCHWCHQMEQDSFVKNDIAEILNQHYVSIKVDREALPAVDWTYSNALQQVKGSSGWPVTAILNTQGEPIFIDSFIRHDQLLQLLSRLVQRWKTQSAFLNRNAHNLMQLANRPYQATDMKWNEQQAQALQARLLTQLDTTSGGFVGTPKFPSEAMLLFALDRLTRQSSPQLTKAVQLQLDNMATRGMYDPVNGGFYRYAEGNDWTSPHFEKMLYTQGLQLLVYSRAAEVFNDRRWLAVIADVVGFLRRWMWQTGSGLSSAVDADFEGIEGGYYLYTADALNRIDKSLADQAGLKRYKMDNGLFGVFLDKPFGKAARQLKAQLAGRFETKPHIDEKILLGWNGLAIWGLAEAARVSGEDSYRQMAVTLAEALWRSHLLDGVLYRASFHQKTSTKANLDDYAFFSRALIALYDLTAQGDWLSKAERLSALAINDLYDDESGFALARVQGVSGALVKTTDDEMVSANGVMVEVLDALWQRTGKPEYRRYRRKATGALVAGVQHQPLDHLYSALVLTQVHEGAWAQTQYFAGGKGKVELVGGTKCGIDAQLLFELQDGWHINANKPFQDNLKPTQIEFGQTKGLAVYPAAQTVQLGFQPDPLSVYQGRFAVMLKTRSSRVLLQLQACSDKICLLPEKLHFYLPSCR